MNRKVKQLEINHKNALTVGEAGFLQYRFFELIVVENNLYGNLLSNAELCPLCIYVIVSSQNKATPIIQFRAQWDVLQFFYGTTKETK